MIKTNLNIEFQKNIHPRVFWDCSFQKLDLEKNKYFIISRVLMRGTDEEIHFIEKNFSMKEILEAVENSPETDDRCINYYRKIASYEEGK